MDSEPNTLITQILAVDEEIGELLEGKTCLNLFVI